MTAREHALDTTARAVLAALTAARIAGEMDKAPEAPPDGRTDAARLIDYRRTALAHLDRAIKAFRGAVNDTGEEGAQVLLF